MQKAIIRLRAIQSLVTLLYKDGRISAELFEAASKDIEEMITSIAKSAEESEAK